MKTNETADFEFPTKGLAHEYWNDCLYFHRKYRPADV